MPAATLHGNVHGNMHGNMHENGGPARVRVLCSPVHPVAVPGSWLQAIDFKTGTGTRRLGESP